MTGEMSKFERQIAADIMKRDAETIATLTAEVARLREGLERIDIHPIDYTIGVAENMQILADIARDTLDKEPTNGK